MGWIKMNTRFGCTVLAGRSGGSLLGHSHQQAGQVLQHIGAAKLLLHQKWSQAAGEKAREM